MKNNFRRNQKTNPEQDTRDKPLLKTDMVVGKKKKKKYRYLLRLMKSPVRIELID